MKKDGEKKAAVLLRPSLYEMYSMLWLCGRDGTCLMKHLKLKNTFFIFPMLVLPESRI